MLAWGYVPDERTIYEGVTRLAPGSRLELDLGAGSSRRERYWSPEPSAEASRVRTLDEACELVEPLLRRAVREHLESDVPVATFLSGGIDSSLVSAYARDASGAGLEAYSVGFREGAFDESPAARETARALSITHTVGMVDESMARAHLADALLAADEPFGDSSIVASYLVARLASRRHKVVFGGDGGDEVFAGYRKHRIVALRGALGPVPFARQALSGALARLPEGGDRGGRYSGALRALGRARRGLEGSDAEGYAALTQIVSFASTAPLAASPAEPERWLAPTLERFRDAPGSALQKTLASDLGGPLPNDMLTRSIARPWPAASRPACPSSTTASLRRASGCRRDDARAAGRGQDRLARAGRAALRPRPLAPPQARLRGAGRGLAARAARLGLRGALPGRAPRARRAPLDRGALGRALAHVGAREAPRPLERLRACRLGRGPRSATAPMPCARRSGRRHGRPAPRPCATPGP